MDRPPINLCRAKFPSRLAAEEFVEKRVLRRLLLTEYCADVREVGKARERVEICDTTQSDYARADQDEPLKRHAFIFRMDGAYRVGLPA